MPQMGSFAGRELADRDVPTAFLDGTLVSITHFSGARSTSTPASSINRSVGSLDFHRVSDKRVDLIDAGAGTQCRLSDLL